MSDLPAPMTSADCDLRDFLFMPLEITRLRRSKAWLIAKRNPEVGFYMINLWAASWQEVPAASLEDDDDVLSDAAMCDPKRWAKVREIVLRGWVKCADGRLYHPVVAEKANASWQAKQARRQRTEAARQARQQNRTEPTSSGGTGSVTENVTTSVTETVTPLAATPATAVVTASKGREGRGKGEGRESKEEEREESPLKPPQLLPDAPPQAAAPTKRERGHRLPADWWPDEECRQFASERGMDPHATAEQFRDYWHSRPDAGATKLDWRMTWRNWCRNNIGRHPAPLPKAPRMNRAEERKRRLGLDEEFDRLFAPQSPAGGLLQ